jgi:hypothetical protein
MPDTYQLFSELIYEMRNSSDPGLEEMMDQLERLKIIYQAMADEADFPPEDIQAVKAAINGVELTITKAQLAVIEHKMAQQTAAATDKELTALLDQMLNSPSDDNSGH